MLFWEGAKIIKIGKNKNHKKRVALGHPLSIKYDQLAIIL